jgi:hypothetical protein
MGIDFAELDQSAERLADEDAHTEAEQREATRLKIKEAKRALRGRGKTGEALRTLREISRRGMYDHRRVAAKAILAYERQA